MLLGSAMLGAVAAGAWENIVSAMSGMSELGEICAPLPETAAWHERRFRAFELLQNAGRKVRVIAEGRETITQERSPIRHSEAPSGIR